MLYPCIIYAIVALHNFLFFMYIYVMFGTYYRSRALIHLSTLECSLLRGSYFHCDLWVFAKHSSLIMCAIIYSFLFLILSKCVVFIHVFL